MAEEPENGRRTVSEQTIMDTIRELEPRATTPKIAEHIGLSPQGTGYRLRNLESENEVVSDTVSNTKIWSVVTNRRHVGPISFSDEIARKQLTSHGKVITFRTNQRTTGYTWWNTERGGEKEDDVIVAEISKADPQADKDLEKYRPLSGFETTQEWRDAIQDLNDDLTEGYLYLTVTDDE